MLAFCKRWLGCLFQYLLNSRYMLDVVLSVLLLSHLSISKMTLRNRYITKETKTWKD